MLGNFGIIVTVRTLNVKWSATKKRKRNVRSRQDLVVFICSELAMNDTQSAHDHESEMVVNWIVVLTCYSSVTYIAVVTPFKGIYMYYATPSVPLSFIFQIPSDTYLQFYFHSFLPTSRVLFISPISPELPRLSQKSKVQQRKIFVHCKSRVFARQLPFMSPNHLSPLNTGIAKAGKERFSSWVLAFCQESGGGWRRMWSSGWFFLIGVSGFSFLQWFDSVVGWQEGHATHINLCHFIPEEEIWVETGLPWFTWKTDIKREAIRHHICFTKVKPLMLLFEY